MYTSNVVNTFLSILSIFYNNTFSHLLRLKVYPSIKTTTDHDGLHVAFSAAENIHYEFLVSCQNDKMPFQFQVNGDGLQHGHLDHQIEKSFLN